MAKIKLAAEIIPANNDFAIADSENIRGGIHNIKSLDDINNVPKDVIKSGTLFYVENEDTYYKYLPDGSLKKHVNLDGYLKADNIVAGDNVITGKDENGNLQLGVVIGDLPANQVYSETLIDVTEDLPKVNITTTSNPSLLPNKQNVSDENLATENKTVVGAINEVLQGMKKIEREAISSQIGNPATGDNSAFEIADIVSDFNRQAYLSLSAGGIGVTSIPLTYSAIVSAIKDKFGTGSGESGNEKWLSLYHKAVNTRTGNFIDYIKLGYSKKEAATMAIANGAYDIEMPKRFDNVIVKGNIYNGGGSYATYINKGTYDDYMCTYYLFYIVDKYNNNSPTDVNPDGAFCFLITTNINKPTLAPKYKLLTITKATNRGIFINQGNRTYFSIDLNGGSASSDDKMYWDSYCEDIYAWDI